MPAHNPLVVALDTADLTRLGQLAAAAGPQVGWLKVGLQAFVAHGPAAVAAAAGHAPVFLDMKLHDIPNTVAGAASAAAGLGVAALTVHASGGPAMLSAAVRAAPDVAVLAVTVLTSMDDADLAAVGQPPTSDQVARLARLAADAGVAGVVCAAPDLAAVRAAVGDAVELVTPGIRPGAAPRGDDQARVASPRAALDAGADRLVIGRPVTAAADPAAALAAIAREVA